MNLAERQPGLTVEQKEARRPRLGASEIATAAGLNPWETPTELVLRKRGQLEEFAGNSKTRAGQGFESVIAHMVAERTGHKLRRSNVSLTHPKYPWLIGHIDRDYVGLEKLLEIKNVSPYMARHWGKDGSDEVPDWYVPQPHVYMMLKGYSTADVAAFFGGDDLRLYPLEADAEIQQWIIDMSHDFHQRYIVGDETPEIDPTHSHALDALKTIHKAINHLEIVADERIDHWHHVWTDAKDQIARLKDTSETAEAQLRAYMGNAGTLLIPSGGRYERKMIHRKAYAVADLDYETMRFIKPKKRATEDESE